MSFFINNEKSLVLVLILSTVAVFTFADLPPDLPHLEHDLQLEQEGYPLDAEHHTNILSNPGGKGIHSRKSGNEGRILITRENAHTLGDLDLSGKESLHSKVLENLPDVNHNGLREQEGNKIHLGGTLESPITVYHPELLKQKVDNHEPWENEEHLERFSRDREPWGHKSNGTRSSKSSGEGGRHREPWGHRLHSRHQLRRLGRTRNHEPWRRERDRSTSSESSEEGSDDREPWGHKSNGTRSSKSSGEGGRHRNPWGYRSHSRRQARRLERTRNREPWEHESSVSSISSKSSEKGVLDRKAWRRHEARLLRLLGHLERALNHESRDHNSNRTSSSDSSEGRDHGHEPWGESRLLRLLEHLERARHRERETQTQPRKMCECPKSEPNVQEYHYEPLKNEASEGLHAE